MHAQKKAMHAVNFDTQVYYCFGKPETERYKSRQNGTCWHLILIEKNVWKGYLLDRQTYVVSLSFHQIWTSKPGIRKNTNHDLNN